METQLENRAKPANLKTFFIFDIDGTLIDSNECHAQAWQYAFYVFDKRVPISRIRAQIGKGSDQLLPEFLNSKEIKKIGGKISELRGAIFKTRFLSEIKAFPQVRQLFKEIRKRDGKIALASSSAEDEVKHFMKIAGIQGLVDHSTSSDSAPASKPEPDIIHAAIRKLGNPRKSSMLMVGDSPFDAVAARKAGIKMVGMCSGGFSARSLIKSGSSIVFENPAHLLKELDRLSAIL
jgi:HAD superfamily hydrolase (TIGR01549 family)